MYHVNPETGEFGICNASCPENYPFGVANHSENYDEIQIKADIYNKKLNKKRNIKLTEEDKNNYELTGRYEEDIRYKIRGGYSTDDIKKTIEITEEYHNKIPVEPDWLSRTDLELYKYLIEKTDYAKIQCDWIKKENNSLVLQKAVMVEDENKKRSKKIFQVTLSKNMNKSDFSPQDIFVKEEFLDIE